MEGSLEASQGKSWFHQKIQMTFVGGVHPGLIWGAEAGDRLLLTA